MNKDVQRLLDQMDKSTPAARTAAAEVAAAVASSPYLQDTIRTSVTAGSLRHIEVAKGAHEGGHYDAETRTIALSPDIMKIGDARQRGDVVTLVLGHEGGHSLLRQYSDRTTTAFENSVRLALNSGEERVNLTEAVKTYVERSRADEGLAELSGWNALQSRVDREPGAITADSLAARAYGATDCVEKISDGRYRLQPNIHVDANQRIRVGHDGLNIDAMAQCHFDGDTNTLGKHGDSNYRHFYGAAAISTIGNYRATYDRSNLPMPEEIALDMKALGLDGTKLERAGLDFGEYGDKLTIWDAAGHGHGSPITLKATSGAAAKLPPTAAPDELHVDPLLADIRRGVHQLDATMGRTPDDASGRMTASLYALARENGLTRVDHVVLSLAGRNAKPGENVFVVQGGMTDPTNRVVHMKTVDAVATPLEQSMQRAAGVELPPPQRAQMREEPVHQQAPAPLQHSRL